MATTNVQQDRPDDPNEAKRELDKNAAATRVDNANASQQKAAEDGNEHGDDIDDLHDQAQEAVRHRAGQFYNNFLVSARRRLDEELKGEKDQNVIRQRRTHFDKRAKELGDEINGKADAIYKDAIKRRGRRQAAMDQLQGAVGLPMDPAQRQREVERRTDEGNAAMLSQTGNGTFMDNLEGRLITALDERPDEYYGDQRLAEYNPHVQQGHGQNIAAQVEAVDNLQRIAPNAPLTRKNVADPEQAAKDHPPQDQGQAQRGPSDQRAGPNPFEGNSGEAQVNRRSDAGSLDPDRANRHGTAAVNQALNNPKTDPDMAGQAERNLADERTRVSREGSQGGLTEEQLRRREQLASGKEGE